MGVFPNMYCQTSGQLVQELNVCTVGHLIDNQLISMLLNYSYLRVLPEIVIWIYDTFDIILGIKNDSTKAFKKAVCRVLMNISSLNIFQTISTLLAVFGHYGNFWVYVEPWEQFTSYF